MGRKLASPAELADVLKVGRSKAYALAKEPWLAALKGAEGWDEDDVLRAQAAQTAGAGLEVGDEDAKVLAAADDPRELAKAAVRLAARRLARDPKASRSKLLDDLNKAVENLRLTEQGFLDLDLRRGKLIELDDAKAACAKLARTFVSALERLQARLATQVELWRGDPEHARLDAEGRARAVRGWLERELGTERSFTESQIRAVIAAEVAAE